MFCHVASGWLLDAVFKPKVPQIVHDQQLRMGALRGWTICTFASYRCSTVTILPTAPPSEATIHLSKLPNVL